MAAFALTEILVVVGIIGVLLFANISAISLSRVTAYRDKDKGIMSDFLIHYAELLKALPFTDVMTNSPVSGLYTGASGTPTVRIPTTTNWVSLNNTNYQNFHPDLVWLTNRAPEMRVVVTTTALVGVTHTAHILVEARWKPPMGIGALVTRRVDVFRVEDN